MVGLYVEFICRECGHLNCEYVTDRRPKIFRNELTGDKYILRKCKESECKAEHLIAICEIPNTSGIFSLPQHGHVLTRKNGEALGIRESEE